MGGRATAGFSHALERIHQQVSADQLKSAFSYYQGESRVAREGFAMVESEDYFTFITLSARRTEISESYRLASPSLCATTLFQSLLQPPSFPFFGRTDQLLLNTHKSY